MERVTGIGGIFFRSREPDELKAWYRDHLGVEQDAEGTVVFHWRETEDPERLGATVWGAFTQDTDYFGPDQEHMVNYRVTDLEAMLDQLRDAGAEVDDRIEDSEYGRFGWATDPEGVRFELWQPPEEW